MPLLVLEGIDGCGKTTQFNLLKDWFEKTVLDTVLFIREPGSTKLGEHLREILLTPGMESVPRAEMLIYMAARAQLLEEVVLPALKKKLLVVMDRYFYSTIAYQVHGFGFGPADAYTYFIERMAYWSVNTTPDLTIFLDISVKEAVKRRAHTEDDRIEKRGEQYFKKVKDGYDAAMKWCEKEGHNIVRVDATQKPKEIFSQVCNHISHLRIEH